LYESTNHKYILKSKQKSKEKFIILQSIGIIQIKSEERRVVQSTPANILIPSVAGAELGTKCPLEYLQVEATALVSLLLLI